MFPAPIAANHKADIQIIDFRMQQAWNTDYGIGWESYIRTNHVACIYRRNSRKLFLNA